MFKLGLRDESNEGQIRKNITSKSSGSFTSISVVNIVLLAEAESWMKKRLNR